MKIELNLHDSQDVVQYLTMASHALDQKVTDHRLIDNIRRIRNLVKDQVYPMPKTKHTDGDTSYSSHYSQEQILSS